MVRTGGEIGDVDVGAGVDGLLVAEEAPDLYPVVECTRSVMLAAVRPRRSVACPGVYQKRDAFCRTSNETWRMLR